MTAPPELVVEPSAAQLAENTAARLVATLVAAQNTRALAFLAVTGGGILEQTMTSLRDLPARDSVDWRRVSLWWGDERFVATDSPERNDRAAFDALFDSVTLSPANVHRMPASDGPWADDIDAAVDAYSADLAAAVGTVGTAGTDIDGDVPHFDALLLGIGPDGHVASLFPEHPGVHELDASVLAVRNSPKPPPLRTSLSFRAIESANEIWIIASGAGKAEAVALALGGAGRVQIPAAGARGRHRTLWLVDRDAASRLPRDYHPPQA